MIKPCRVLVTGANGFIGRNLVIRLKELSNIEVLTFTKDSRLNELKDLVLCADFIFHLAGVNRSVNINEFSEINVGLTEVVCDAIQSSGRNIPMVLSSSIHAVQDNPYGKSKYDAECVVQKFVNETGNTAYIYRLPGVFGKWSRPNYNSVVATFCHNIARGLPIQIDDPNTILNLVYIDDVIDEFISLINDVSKGLQLKTMKETNFISVGSLAEKIFILDKSRTNLMTEHVGEGLIRALYSTYISYLPPERFLYDLPLYRDDRGIFVEMLKTSDSGQFSFFTVHPGITRGSHYHHTKTEKFLIVKGSALMKFRNLLTDERTSFFICADKPQIVDSVPGWVHDITNIGSEDAIIMLWANEIFNRNYPDCIPCKV